MSASDTTLVEEAATASSTSPEADWLGAAAYLLSESATKGKASGSPAIIVGKLAGIATSGLPLVEFSGNSQPNSIVARHTCAVSKSDIGREAVLIFENGDLSRPIVLGLLQPAVPGNPHIEPRSVDVSLDGKQVTLSAENEIVLRCGKASITLTRAGKVLINGEYLLSRSNGVNRIKGGSVQIN
ncbi:MAG TPA: DUF6484 domain-containing protein [Verrucomicrobiae bacterium]